MGGTLGLAFMGGIIFLANQPPGWPFNWDAEKVIAGQPAEARAEGRVGVVAVALLQPAGFDTPFYDNFIRKLLDTAIPWPINQLAGRDNGVALIDPTRPDEQQAFSPTRLINFAGRAEDWDGVPFVEKWKRGQVDFVPPSATVAGDIGTFRYGGRAGGAPGPAQRAMLKARAIYYPRLPMGYLPQRDQTLAMAEYAFQRLREHPSVAATAVFDAFNPHHGREAIWPMLDAGIDTLVVASTLPIHSSFEEYHGTYPKLYAMVKEWAERRGKPMPKLLFAPQLADTPGYPGFWAAHLARVAPPPPAPDASATLVVSLHGLPIRQIDRDRWRINSARATRRLVPALEAALRSKGWQKIRVEVAQEAFGDDVEDPGNKLVSVNEVFQQARARKDALAIAVPVEFLSENTDTLFLHAYLMFDGLPGYRRFAGPPADTDWQQPLVRRFVMGGTTHIYTGSPGGDAQAQAGALFADSVLALLPVPGPEQGPVRE
jgi:hypothetical protein